MGKSRGAPAGTGTIFFNNLEKIDKLKVCIWPEFDYETNCPQVVSFPRLLSLSCSCGRPARRHHHPDNWRFGRWSFPQLQANRIFHSHHAQTTQVNITCPQSFCFSLLKVLCAENNQIKVQLLIFIQPQQPGEVSRYWKRSDFPLGRQRGSWTITHCGVIYWHGHADGECPVSIFYPRFTSGLWKSAGWGQPFTLKGQEGSECQQIFCFFYRMKVLLLMLGDSRSLLRTRCMPPRLSPEIQLSFMPHRYPQFSVISFYLNILIIFNVFFPV